jgi:HAD superfamily hydrolase (TIGR01509 family)
LIKRMNTERGPAAALDDVLGRAAHLLLDFDGPICSLFAGTPTAPVAGRIRDVLVRHDIRMPQVIENTSDWFEILAFAASAGHEVGARAEAELTRVECRAAAAAVPTAHLPDVLAACRESARSVAVVSNNSEQAVRWYLAEHGLDAVITVVAARSGNVPERLKPSPHFVEAAAAQLSAKPSDCALVGDSASDMRAARAAGSPGIGYARTPGEHGYLAAAGAATVVSSLADLASGIRASRPRPAPGPGAGGPGAGGPGAGAPGTGGPG